MPRWIELITSLRGTDVHIYALAPGNWIEQSDYWQGLEQHVHLAVPLDDSVLPDFGWASIPTTIALRSGNVEAFFVGVLSPWQQSVILTRLR